MVNAVTSFARSWGVHSDDIHADAFTLFVTSSEGAIDVFAPARPVG